MTKTFHEKLLAVAAAIDYLSKDGRNEEQNYRYVSEAAVKAAVRRAFLAEGLAVCGVEMASMPGTRPCEAVVYVRLTVSDGERNAAFAGVGSAAELRRDGTPFGDKAVMKATAAAVKYALTTAFLIPTGDDPEATAPRGADAGSEEAW